MKSNGLCTKECITQKLRCKIITCELGDMRMANGIYPARVLRRFRDIRDVKVNNR